MAFIRPRVLLLHKKEGTDDYYFLFTGLDEKVVYRTQRFRYEQQKPPIQFCPYFKAGKFWPSVSLVFNILVVLGMAKRSYTRNLLLKYPKYYSRGYVTRSGPTDIVMNNTFFTFELIGEGWEAGVDVNSKPNKTVVAKVSGVNPAYGATCVAMLSSAVTILQEREQLPIPGGVLTTGAAFQNTNLINKLIENNLKFEIIENKKI